MLLIADSSSEYITHVRIITDKIQFDTTNDEMKCLKQSMLLISDGSSEHVALMWKITGNI